MLTNTLFKILIKEYATTEIISIDTFDKFLIDLDLRDEFFEHNVNKVKGFVFEYITKYDYLSRNLEVYLFNEIPSDVRRLFNLGMKDNGIDLLYNENDEWISVQCKWREKTNLSIHKNQILGFLEEAKQFNKRVLVTNVQTKNKYIVDRYDIGWVLRKDFEKIINRNLIDFIINETKLRPIVKKQKNFILRNCQSDALNSLVNSKLTKKQCIMFCGTGKSIVMIEYIKLKNVNRVVVLMPSLQLISQFYNNLKGHVDKQILCICSKFDKSSLTGGEVDDNQGDNLLNEYLKFESNNITYTTNQDVIGKELKKNNLIVLCTYQSSKLVEDFRFDLGLFDEAHKTVNSDMFGFTLYDRNCHINERVFFTATPKYYKGKDEKCISMSDEKIYGKEVFNYPYFQAKNDGYVLDFEIITYIVPENMEDLVNEKYIKKDNLNVRTEVLISALMIAQHIKNNDNSKKILTYHNSIINAVEFKKTLAYVFFKYEINIKVFTMCGNTSMEKRKDIFDEYETSKLAIICSSRVLNEGIDLPCTDTIAFVDPRSSTIDVTQCFGRADRIYGDQKKCSIIIPVHYNQVDGKHNYGDTIKILSAMSEIDNKLIANFVGKNVDNKINMVQMNIDCEIEYDKDGEAVKYNFGEVNEGLSLAIIESKVLGFDYKMNLLFKFCEENKCAPKYKTNYKGQNIGLWLMHNKQNINNIDDELYKKLSINEYIKSNLDEYLINKEKNKNKEKLDFDQWQILLFNYCNENKCTPQNKIKYENQNINNWLHHTKKKINTIDDELYKKLSVNKYVKENLDEYLINREKNKDKKNLNFEQWKTLLFNYCEENKYTPPNKANYENYNIGQWYQDQKKKVNKIDDEIYKKLSVNEYVKKNLEEYLNPDIKWNQTCNLVFKYSNENKCAPLHDTKYENQNIGLWLNVTQKRNINSVDDDLYKKLSKNIYVKENLDEYLKNVEKNSGKVKLDFEQWKELLFKYANENKCAPMGKIIYENQHLGSWFTNQKGRKKIINIDDELYKTLSVNEYIKENLDKYLAPNESWNTSCNLLFKYCNENKCSPKSNTIYENYNIGSFLGTQKKDINNINDSLYKKLSVNIYVKENLDKYIKNVENNKGKEKLEWEQSKSILFAYCNENNCEPKSNTIYQNYNIGSWLASQKKYINNINDILYKKLSVNIYVKDNLDKYLKNIDNNKGKEKLEWDQWQKLLFEFCEENKRVPQQREKYKNYGIGGWLQKYRLEINSINDELYKKLSTNEYVKQNLDEHLNPDNKLKELLFKYCIEYKCAPQQRTKYENQNIGMWLQNRRLQINSTEDELYKKLSVNEYIKKNLDEHLRYKEKNKDIEKLDFDQLKIILFNYSNENKCIPPARAKYENQNIGNWFHHKKQQINTINDEIYIKLSANEYVKKNLDEYLTKKNKS